ncbi:MAG: VOC family protein [Actinobacteria bacterium]|nr:VOC family protein [Actinomycetota bacterium]
MALHRLSSFTYAVPNLAEVTAYYSEFGLTDNGDGSFSTLDGGKQLYLEQGSHRRITTVELGADNADDLDRIASSLKAMDIDSAIDGDRLTTADPVTKTRVVVVVQERVEQPRVEAVPFNGPGRVERVNSRADGVMRESRVTPRKLGHVLIVSPESLSTIRFFSDGLGFKVSDYANVKSNAFMRCSEDHHNIGIFGGDATYPHHSSWQVDDVDDIGRGAEDLLNADENRQGWGFGRHFAGSNFFWYLKDPAGTMSEYYCDMDLITDDDLWVPQIAEGPRGLYRWGPKPPEAFLRPADIAELIAAQNN